MSAPGLGFNIEPVTASSAGIWGGPEIGFSTGSFSLHGDAAPSSNHTMAIIVAGALVAIAIFMRGRK